MSIQIVLLDSFTSVHRSFTGFSADTDYYTGVNEPLLNLDLRPCGGSGLYGMGSSRSVGTDPAS